MLATLESHLAALELEDGASVQFYDGAVAFAGRRQLRDGARVALLTVPGLLRLDLRCEADTLDFSLRHYSGRELEGPVLETEVRPVMAADGTYRHEYHYEFALVDGPEVQIVVWLEQFRGELVREQAAVALIIDR